MQLAGNKIEVETLREWLDNNKPVFVLDVRPQSQREEWKIPGSHYLDAYDRLWQGDISVLDEIEIPKDVPIVTVCAAGKTSQIAADALQQKGFIAHSLEGGMKAWSKAWNLAKKTFHDFEVLQVRRTGKGCLSYIITSGSEAIIIDASVPVSVYQELIRERNLTVKYVIETHIHADHLSRSKQLAALLNAPLYLPYPNKVHFSYKKIGPSTIFSLGNADIKCIPTPGHTIESYSFYIEGAALFTGDTLFTKGVGRPDLKADAYESKTRAGLLYHSLQNLIALPDNVIIFPAHTSTPIEFDNLVVSTTIKEAKHNAPLLSADEPSFVNSILGKIPPPPSNYLTIVEKNLEGDFSETDSIELESGANRCAIS